MQPDWAGRYLRGTNSSFGTKVSYLTGKPKTTAFSLASDGAHSHKYGSGEPNISGSGDNYNPAPAGSSKQSSTEYHSHQTNGGGDFTTRPDSVVVNFAKRNSDSQLFVGTLEDILFEHRYLTGSHINDEEIKISVDVINTGSSEFSKKNIYLELVSPTINTPYTGAYIKVIDEQSIVDPIDRYSITGSKGSDLLIGGKERDDLHGGMDNDTIEGHQGSDHLRGEDGNDVLAGGSSRDVINGGSGQDFIDGGTGQDQLTGGSGRDRFTLSPSPSAGKEPVIYSEVNEITDFQSDKDLIITEHTYTIYYAYQDQTRILFSQNREDLSGVTGTLIRYSDGDTYISDVSPDDGIDISQPIDPEDIINYLGDKLILGFEEGNDNPQTLSQFPSGENKYFQGADRAEVMHGLGGDDLLNGGGKNDTLKGGLGADTLNGGKGNDVLIGGEDSKADTYVLSEGQDIVRDFQLNDDLIQWDGELHQLGYTEIDFIDDSTQRDPDPIISTVISIVAGDLKGSTTTLVGIPLNEFLTQEPLPIVDPDGDPIDPDPEIPTSGLVAATRCDCWH